VFGAAPFDPPAEILAHAHERLRATRGAAAVLLHLRPGEVVHAGVGNVSVALVGERRRSLVSSNGTVGLVFPRVTAVETPLLADDVVVVHTDGLSARWMREEQVGLWRRHPAVVAGALFRDHRRERDDATVVVIGPRGGGIGGAP
jgi:hypothetical protein